MKKIWFSAVILLMFSGEIFSQFDYGFDFSKAGSAGLQFLKVGSGARETAMGEAAAAIVNDANAVFWNPAGISYLTQGEAVISHNRWLADSKHNAAAAAYPVGSFVIALSAVSLSINDFEETTVVNPEGTGRMVSAGDLLIGVAAARRFTDRLSIGLQIKYVQEKLDDRKIGNILFDVGTIYSTGFRNLTLGFSLQHFGPDMKLVEQEFRTPLLFRVSATDRLLSMDNYKLSAAVELVHPTDNVEWVNTGLELSLFDMLALRGGYRFSNDLSKASFGVGIAPPAFSDISLRVDYSYTPSETIFNDIQRFTIGIKF